MAGRGRPVTAAELRAALTSAFQAGNLATVNSLVATHQLTSPAAAALFGRADVAAWSAAQRANGVLFYEDQIRGAGSVPGALPAPAAPAAPVALAGVPSWAWLVAGAGVALAVLSK